MTISLPSALQRQGRARPRTRLERMWLIGGGVLAAVLFLVGYLFFIAPQRAQTGDVNSKSDSVRTHNATLSARLDALRTQYKDLPRYQAQLAAARSALPATSGVPDFVRSLQSLGNATLTQVSSLTVGQPTTIAPPAAAAGSTPSAGAGSTPSAGAASTPSAPTSAIPGVYSLAITAQVIGSPAALNKFLEQLQNVQPRAVLITQITEGSSASAAGPSTGTVLQLTMFAFVAPPASGSPAAATAAAPAPR